MDGAILHLYELFFIADGRLIIKNRRKYVINTSGSKLYLSGWTLQDWIDYPDAKFLDKYGLFA